MRKICIVNQKGGVGKTTTSINLAAGLALEGVKVLLIDIDPQGSVSSCLKKPAEKNIYHVMLENCPFEDCIVNVHENFDVILSDEALTRAEQMLAGEPARETVLKRKLNGINGYDFILVDCPPSLGVLTQNALLFCDEAFVPTSTDVLGILGLNRVTRAIMQMNDVFGHNVKITKVIPTMYDTRNKICKSSLAYLRDKHYSTVSDPIRMNSKLKESPKDGQTIFQYANSSNGAKDYRSVINTVLSETKEVATVKHSR